MNEIMPERYAIDLNLLDGSVGWEDMYLGAIVLGWEPYDTIIELLQGRADWDCLFEQTDDGQKRRRKLLNQAQHYFIRDDCLYRRGNVFAVPRRIPYMDEVISLIRDVHEGFDKHLGYTSVIQILAKKWYWVGMAKMVKEYVNGCTTCEQRRFRSPTKFQLYRIGPPASLFVRLGMDTLMLPTSHGFSELVTTIDYTSDFGDAFAVRGLTKGPQVVKAIQNWITRFGKPLFIVMDNALYFTGGEFAAFAGRERIRLIPASVYTLEGNAKAENFNGQLTYTLARITLAQHARDGRTHVEDAAKRWYPALGDAIRVRNQHVSRVTGLSPYQYVFGQDPPVTDQLTTDIIEEFTEQQEQNLELVAYLREHALRHRIAQHEAERNNNLPEPLQYREGDLVWYYQKEQDQGHGTERKILPRWKGPYQVELALEGGAYYLKDPDSGERISKGTINHRLMLPVRRPPEWYEPGNLGAILDECAHIGGLRSGFAGDLYNLDCRGLQQC